MRCYLKMELAEIKGLFSEMDIFFNAFEKDALKKKLPSCNPKELADNIKKHIRILLLEMYRTRGGVTVEMAEYYSALYNNDEDDEVSDRDELEKYVKPHSGIAAFLSYRPQAMIAEAERAGASRSPRDNNQRKNNRPTAINCRSGQ